MARPRVFISSTFYDLKSLRDDLDRFITSYGFESVRHERGHIAYGSKDKPEAYAYKEIDYCDILVCVLGGRFGSHASDGTSSITHAELRTAFELGKQIYIFVERSVHSEHRYYLANKSIPGVTYTAVDNVKIYEFLEEVFQLPRGNPVFSFEVFADIASILREQWAGLFQRLLSEAALSKQSALHDELQRSLQTVGELVKFLTAEKEKGSEAIQEILFANHPLFEAVRKATKTKYRIYFRTLNEFEAWLKAARSFERVEEKSWDSPAQMEWVREYERPGKPNEMQLLKVERELFDSNGKLRPISPDQWKNDWVQTRKWEKGMAQDDDIPF